MRHCNRILLATILTFMTLCVSDFAYSQVKSKREVISLNGTWKIAEGGMDLPGSGFDHSVPVPGLVTLATPSFKDVAPKVQDRRDPKKYNDPLREAFWYSKTFSIDEEIPEIAILKVFKAKYSTKVIVNGKEIGIHQGNFTPGYFDVRDALQTGENKLFIRVGASRAAVPDSVPDGFDYEKERYIPGIYDNVELILSGSPYISSVQTAPDIVNNEVQIQIKIDPIERKRSPIEFSVKETKSGKEVGSLRKSFDLSREEENTITVRVPIKDVHLWSPESPFLYSLEVKTSGDSQRVKFGMRDFHFDHLTNIPMLNGAPYYLRGTNITLYRFFEDSLCKGLPWDTVWVRRFLKSFKQFHWNSMRLCIGLPPSDWYRIADEEGIMLQDEFPIWYGGKGWNTWPKELSTTQIAAELREMIEEDWNHPSVIIFDASNENISDNGETDKVGDALWSVRNIDLSNRPWDNSYSPHRAPGDVYESHPYHFSDSSFELKNISTADIIPHGNLHRNLGRFPVIINEYGWLWLNRDGTPTTLTEKLYQNLLGKGSTSQERWRLYANYMAAETEFWRVHRKAAGVLFFTALGYSRNDGQTSDIFVNPTTLEYQKDFLERFPDAFNPVGVMLDEWGNEIEGGKSHEFNVMSINDTQNDWAGRLKVQISIDGEVKAEKEINFNIPSYGQEHTAIEMMTPEEEGEYKVEAILVGEDNTRIKSIREIPIR